MRLALMTRDEFIDYWLANSDGLGESRLADGVLVSGRPWRALPCACPEPGCRGWAMVPDDLVEHHMRFYAPKVGAAGGRP
jgi:hypothetical protein